MMIRKLQSGPFAERARRSAREIALACALTFAALVFGVAALYRNASETASMPVTPPPQSQAIETTPFEAQPVDGQATAPSETTTKDL
ncbi:hypothetical protein [Hyphomicrobium sp.]|uniref:hypothetical protein n=1 Tax=Hyphomicrobium sp. TaxID=82 RepID=UPI002B79D418|nr:hypothetical protein [Hyphomicrobium sp.]HRN88893.1 hypothetical protein [Hyphomicrobium sp.]HRQ28237.1 hypothetical protein [Hyphomicrobium sp.]